MFSNDIRIGFGWVKDVMMMSLICAYDGCMMIFGILGLFYDEFRSVLESVQVGFKMSLG